MSIVVRVFIQHRCGQLHRIITNVFFSSVSNNIQFQTILTIFIHVTFHRCDHLVRLAVLLGIVIINVLVNIDPDVFKIQILQLEAGNLRW